jgi:hypothetical protein
VKAFNNRVISPYLHQTNVYLHLAPSQLRAQAMDFWLT